MATAGQATTTIAAAPDAVYALISDVIRTGEWSPECVHCEWVGDTTAATPGARFRGHNKQGNREWDMECVIDEAEPGAAFSFHTERNGAARTKWGYRLTPEGTGTRLTEWYERVAPTPALTRLVERLVMGGRQKHNDANVAASLKRIKSIIEGTANYGHIDVDNGN
jgi:uncharacterized protein YndB with AHSA1/START domain